MGVVGSIVETVRLLRFVKERLSLATQAWTGFSDPYGDISCFHDIRNTRGRVTINSIKTSFRELVDLEKTMSSLIVSCEVSAKNVRTLKSYKNEN